MHRAEGVDSAEIPTHFPSRSAFTSQFWNSSFELWISKNFCRRSATVASLSPSSISSYRSVSFTETRPSAVRPVTRLIFMTRGQAGPSGDFDFLLLRDLSLSAFFFLGAFLSFLSCFFFDFFLFFLSLLELLLLLLLQSDALLWSQGCESKNSWV